ncbi:PEPxxWA-CTERM sorting domain-containing protein [Sphingomonas sp.]|uniref:PEPxxWA-CTERM sorting domain-containing protein n=1 Tax=Sphingomonas sp. TaxID=28214 RepID=UPI0025D9896D|nr:PEPxxWA-CTERM sorting domain-containing protein [Sphingomonas sp.]
MVNRIARASLLLGAAMAGAGSAEATQINISLGPSAENLTLYGMGETLPGSGVGTFALGQGASSYDAGTNLSTFTFSGAIDSSNLSGFGAGTYEIVTTYAGPDTPAAGPAAPHGQSNPSNLNFFFYTTLDPSMDMTLYLHSGGDTFVKSLIENGAFTGVGFSFGYVSATCTGIAGCAQNDVGVTPGASIAGTVRTNLSFEMADPVPEPASWLMMIGGFGMVGGALRRHRMRTAIVHFG